MIPMAPQQMGTPPVAAARRGRDVRPGLVLPGHVRHGRRPVVSAPAHVAVCPLRRRDARDPYAGVPATRPNGHGNGIFVGFWAPNSLVAGTSLTIKRPTRHLVSRTT